LTSEYLGDLRSNAFGSLLEQDASWCRELGDDEAEVVFEAFLGDRAT
jgi:hypothetical protein